MIQIKSLALTQDEALEYSMSLMDQAHERAITPEAQQSYLQAEAICVLLLALVRKMPTA